MIAAQNDLASTGGEVACLPATWIALQASGHLKAPLLGRRICNDDGESLRSARRVCRPVLEVHHHVAATAVYRDGFCRVQVALWDVARVGSVPGSTSMPRIRPRGVGIQQRRANKEHGRKPCKYPILSTHMFTARKDGSLLAGHPLHVFLNTPMPFLLWCLMELHVNSLWTTSKTLKGRVPERPSTLRRYRLYSLLYAGTMPLRWIAGVRGEAAQVPVTPKIPPAGGSPQDAARRVLSRRARSPEAAFRSAAIPAAPATTEAHFVCR